MDLATFMLIKERMEELGSVTDKGVMLPRSFRLSRILGCCYCGCERGYRLHAVRALLPGPPHVCVCVCMPPSYACTAARTSAFLCVYVHACMLCCLAALTTGRLCAWPYVPVRVCMATCARACVHGHICPCVCAWPHVPVFECMATCAHA